MAKESAGAPRAFKAVRMADPSEVLRTIWVVLRAGSPLALPWARALVASGICGV